MMARRDGFPLTREFLAQMLDIRRAGVREIASSLQRAGLITERRGMMILDRAGLAACVCACFQVIGAAYERIRTP